MYKPFSVFRPLFLNIIIIENIITNSREKEMIIKKMYLNPKIKFIIIAKITICNPNTIVLYLDIILYFRAILNVVSKTIFSSSGIFFNNSLEIMVLHHLISL